MHIFTFMSLQYMMVNGVSDIFLHELNQCYFYQIADKID